MQFTISFFFLAIMHPSFVICVLYLLFFWYEMESLAVAVFPPSRGMLHNLGSLDICAICSLSKYRNLGGSRGRASFSLLFFLGVVHVASVSGLEIQSVVSIYIVRRCRGL